MSEWKQKRFWKQVTVTEAEEGFGIELDGRKVRTPAKAVLAVPGRAMAEAIAAEWDAQEGAVRPMTMPFTRSANAALDKVARQHDEVAQMIVAYGDADLLCYRAEGPAELVARQSEGWDPALGWSAEVLGARLEPRAGVIHAPQDPVALARLTGLVRALSPFQMVGFHDLVSLSGSLVLGFAAARDWRPADEIWTLSRLDEIWQQEQWGEDEEAMALAETRRQSFLHAKRFFDLSA